MSTTVSLLNMKGGVGKTTLAVNLAWYLHKTGPSNVLLVDLDPQFNATQYVMDYKAFEAHRKKAGTIVNLLIDQPHLRLKSKRSRKALKPSTVLHNIEENGGKRLDLLPAELELAWVVKNPAQMDYRLEKLLGELRSDYEFIIIDCAPTDSVLTTMALTASDHLLIPMRPDQFSILGFANLMQTIEVFRKNCPNPHNVKIAGIVFTQVTDDSAVEEQSIGDITKAAADEGIYLFSNLLKYSMSFARSIKDQTPIFETLHAKPKSRAGVGKIAEEMKLQIAAEPAKKVKK